jgi:hypothetical protein
MKSRVEGKVSNPTKNNKYYLGLPIMPRDVFLNWARNHPDFLRLYKAYVSSDFNQKLAPTLNRINSSKGYTLDNVEWMTHSLNCSLAGSVLKRKNQKAIYELLGVTK